MKLKSFLKNNEAAWTLGVLILEITEDQSFSVRKMSVIDRAISSKAEKVPY